ncbi:hypothetical protein ACM1RC_22340 [Paenibacillus azoreducens]|uniref:hypothetical protein n=1 Tax=Paenibacillus azoreducens TaxID=116718 RepID=UPI0039F5F0FE
MRAVAFFVVGVLLMALSGIEKISLYISLAKSTGNTIETLKNIIPPYIWNITNYTFIAGGILTLIGLFLFFYEKRR